MWLRVSQQPQLVNNGCTFFLGTEQWNILAGCIWVSAAADFGPAGVLERCDMNRLFRRILLTLTALNKYDLQ
jgi:hypothetical protein